MHLSNLTLTFWKAELFPISPSLVLLHFALFIFFHLNTTGNNFRRADGAKLSLASDFCCTFSFFTFSFLLQFLLFVFLEFWQHCGKAAAVQLKLFPDFWPKFNFFLLSKSTFLTQHTFVLPAELIQFVF